MERIRSELRASRAGNTGRTSRGDAGPGEFRATVTPIEQSLGELIGDALILQEAAARTLALVIVPETGALLREIGDTQRRLFAGGRIHAEDFAGRQRIRLVLGEYLEHRVPFMDSYLTPGFRISDGLDFIAMCLAEVLGRWSVLARQAESDRRLTTLSRDAQEIIRPQLTAVVVAASRQDGSL